MGITSSNFFSWKCFILIFAFFIPIENLFSDENLINAGFFPAAPLVSDTDGEPDGFFVELLERIAEEDGWQLNWIKGAWNEQLHRLEKGELDILPAVGLTMERMDKFDFSILPAYIDSGVLYIRKDDEINDLKSLEGKKVAGVEGSIFTKGFIDYLSSFGVESSILYTSNNIEAMQYLEQGKVDAAICIYSLGNELTKSFNVKITSVTFSPINLMYAVKKGESQEFLEYLNRRLSELIHNENSYYYELYQKWINPKPESWTIPMWIKSAVMFLLLAAGIMIVWIVLLRLKVKSRTWTLETEVIKKTKVEEELKSALEQKDLLLHELYHRNKNTLQMIYGMIQLKSFEFSENRLIHEFVKSMGSRIMAISLVHQMLYEADDFSRISLDAYIKQLTDLNIGSFSDMDTVIDAEISVDKIYLEIDAAVPFGLVLNELITNSLKYAFKETKRGLINITLHKTENNYYILEYSDDGIQIENISDISDSSGFGIRMIKKLVESQLNGRLYFSAGTPKGLTCRIELPETLYNPRLY